MGPWFPQKRIFSLLVIYPFDTISVEVDSDDFSSIGLYKSSCGLYGISFSSYNSKCRRNFFAEQFSGDEPPSRSRSPTVYGHWLTRRHESGAERIGTSAGITITKGLREPGVSEAFNFIMNYSPLANSIQDDIPKYFV